MSETYQDLFDLVNTVEAVPGGTETEDYSEFELLFPGKYINPARRITAKQDKKTGKITFQAEMTGGLVKDGRTYGVGRPRRNWFSTALFQDGDRPGLTSGVAKYLRHFGIDSTAGLSPEELIQMVADTANAPVGVFVGWENKTEKTGETDPVTGKDVYEKATLKTKDFNVGTKDNPVYKPTVVINGRTFEARDRISGFFTAE